MSLYHGQGARLLVPSPPACHVYGPDQASQARGTYSLAACKQLNWKYFRCRSLGWGRTHLVAGRHRETDARPCLVLDIKSRNSQYRPAARFAHAATSILEVVVTRNRDRPPVILRSSGRSPRGFPVDRPGLVSFLRGDSSDPFPLI